MIAFAPPAGPDDDPFAMFGGLGPQLGLMLLLAAVAVAVVWLSRRAGKGKRSSGGKRRPGWADPQWRATVEAMRAAPTKIASAKPGDVCVLATLANAPLSLGGPPERACVWRNTMGADASLAVGAELVFVADDSGRAALEHLERARVIAPTETAPGRRGNERTRRIVALYIGDTVEICARFDVDKVGNDPDPRKLVYGTLGATGPIEIRVIERPTPRRQDLASPDPSDANSNDANSNDANSNDAGTTGDAAAPGEDATPTRDASAPASATAEPTS